MKKNNYKEIQPNSRNKKFELKTILTSLADDAKARINNNKVLRELILIQENQISEYKKKFLQYSSFKLIAKSKKEFSDSIKKELNLNNSQIKLDNDSLQRLIKALKIKYDGLAEKGREVNDTNINDIDSVKEKNFLILNAIQSKENYMIYILKNILKFKEDMNKITLDSIEYDENELEDEIDLRDELKKIMDYHTLLCDQKLSQINQYINDCKKISKKISQLKTSRKKIKKFIKTLTNLITNFDCISFPDNRNIIIEGEECLQETNEISESIPLDNNAMSFSDESDSFLNEGDLMNLDFKECELIKNIFYEEKTKLVPSAPIPKIDLTLINFNKQKLNYDYNEKSLSRNDMKEHDLLSLRIIKLKDEIKVLSEKNNKLNEKIKKYAEKIYKLNNVLFNMNYKSPNSFKIKSVKKRKFIFNQTSAFSNASRNTKSLSLRVDGIHKKNQLKLNDEEYSSNI